MHIFFWLLIFSPVVLVLAWIFTFGRDGDFERQFFSLFGTVALTTLAVVMVESYGWLVSPATTHEAAAFARTLGTTAVRDAQAKMAPGPGLFVDAAVAHVERGAIHYVTSGPARVVYSVSYSNGANSHVAWACLTAGLSSMTYSVTPGKCLAR